VKRILPVFVLFITTSITTLVASVAITTHVLAQDFATGPPLPEFPQVYQTTEYAIQVDLVAGGLSNPWSIAFLPSGDMLVTERAGRLRLIRNGELDPLPVSGVPQVKTTVLGGLLDVVLHPDFATNRTLYLSYAKGHEDGTRSTTAIARAMLNANTLVGLQDIFVANSWSASPTNFGGRMVFGTDDKLYMAIGERQEEVRAQDMMDHGGKVIRLNEDGTVPEDNPFTGRDDVLPAIYALGVRSPQGLALNPDTGELWENEHGPLGGDEINIIKAGANYGWPLVSWGREYSGAAIPDPPTRPELAGSLRYWDPVIAPSGMAFYQGAALPAWHGSLLIGGLASQGLVRLTLEGERVTAEERIALGARIRDVEPGPDGAVYLLTDEADGRLLRLRPAGG